MNYGRRRYECAEIEFSTFSAEGAKEIHLYVKPTPDNCFDNQLEGILDTLNSFIEENSINKKSVVFTRFFVSDYANQTNLIKSVKSFAGGAYNNCALSVVQQPPLNGTKVILWAYLVVDEKLSLDSGETETGFETILKRGDYEHIWSTHLITSNGSTKSYDQTNNIFNNYNAKLQDKGLTIKDNCLRTWLFVKDVDFNYQGVVDARREFFEGMDMTKDTHFIASTGIEGRHANPNINVLMDAYTVGGIQNDQLRFLEAPEMLNSTHEYGVTFERGTSIDYGDRRHTFISGTASIDKIGEVIHKRNISKQITRTLENISALLATAETEMKDIAQMIIYLRDIADKEEVDTYFQSNYSDVPKVIVLAPVCRPEWLIEIECIAIKKIEKTYKNF